MAYFLLGYSTKPRISKSSLKTVWRVDRDKIVLVNVRLFGILNLLSNERLVTLPMAEGATLGDVLTELGKRFGREFMERILRAPGEMHSYCRVFVDNDQVDDLNKQLVVNGSAAEVGMILLLASDGG